MAVGDFIEAAEVARLLGISVSATHQLAQRGTLPSQWIARRRVWRRDLVLKFRSDPEYQKRSRRPGQLVLGGLEMSTEEAIASMRAQMPLERSGFEPVGRKRGEGKGR